MSKEIAITSEGLILCVDCGTDTRLRTVKVVTKTGQNSRQAKKVNTFVLCESCMYDRQAPKYIFSELYPKAKAKAVHEYIMGLMESDQENPNLDFDDNWRLLVESYDRFYLEDGSYEK